MEQLHEVMIHLAPLELSYKAQYQLKNLVMDKDVGLLFFNLHLRSS
jgi:hypothetical protein